MHHRRVPRAVAKKWRSRLRAKHGQDHLLSRYHDRRAGVLHNRIDVGKIDVDLSRHGDEIGIPLTPL